MITWFDAVVGYWTGRALAAEWQAAAAGQRALAAERDVVRLAATVARLERERAASGQAAVDAAERLLREARHRG